MSDTQRAEIEEEVHALNSLISAVGWEYFKKELAEQANGLSALVGPPKTIDDFTMLGLLTHVGKLMQEFPTRLEARRENLVTFLETMKGADDD